MGTTKRRQSKRNNSRQAALSFLSNITLGNENEVRNSSTTTTMMEPPTTTTAPPFSDTSIATATATAVSGRSNLTRYGTLSVTNDTTAKGIAPDSSDSNSSTMDEHIPISLTVDTSRRISVAHALEPASANSVHTPLTPGGNNGEKRRLRRESTSESFYNHRRLSSSSSTSSEVIHQYKLTREDSERPIASEKIKKRADPQDTTNPKNSETGSMGFMSVFRYYKGIIRQPKRRSEYYNHNHHVHYPSYFHQHLSTMHLKHRKALSYGHFLSPQSEQVVPHPSSSSDEITPITKLLPRHVPSSYDPYYLDDETTLEYPNFMISSQGSIADINMIRASTSNAKKKELNELFRKTHPEISTNLTLSKINAIKSHLLQIGKVMDLEISSVSHAFVYFEKLVLKHVVNKQNRKLLAACCLFLATKVNEPKGSWFKSLLETIHAELNVNSKDVRDYEFAVFADLDFNLYVPISEFMPHFERICQALEIQCIEDHLGGEAFYKITEGGYEIAGAATSSDPTSPN
ncbi:hypothetical protein INT47_011438 [Mucor saturninus]|uniref:Cyclin-like domain-containing protein n=1 Tax=Mucor saturninus TaxID=64648 RepID=A0A8H7QZA6_9FUNG|nr:hypothetical protein INT47_011438 [Mucor saturninus]